MKQNNNAAFEALKVYMVENYGAKLASGGREILKRCHFCGDSRDVASKHLYIGMKDGLIVYNCFKCPAQGIVDGKFFRDLGCYDIDLINICNQNNKNNATYTENVRKTHFLKNVIPKFMYREAPESFKKLEYLNNRLGVNLTFNDLARFKIILNLYDYINANTIGNLTRYKDICDQLDQVFIGFLSADNSYINFRRIIPEGIVHKNIDTRYVNYNIYGLLERSSKYYTIPCMIDPSKPLTIRIAEGVFDILGVYLNTDCSKDNTIFASIGGKSYMNIVTHLILNYGFMKFDLHIYVDNDVDNFEIKKTTDLLRPIGCKIYIHRNLFPGEKDYGVSRSRIVDSISLIY